MGLASQTMAPGTIPYGIVLYNHPATYSIVGANIYLCSIVGAGQNTHTVRPPMCLWASTILWAPEFTIEKILYLALKIMLLSYLTWKLKIFLICPELEFFFPI